MVFDPPSANVGGVIGKLAPIATVDSIVGGVMGKLAPIATVDWIVGGVTGVG
jgi:hypothetical protein